MAEDYKDFEQAWLDEQIEHPVRLLDGPARYLVEDLQQMYQTPPVDTSANAESLRRVQSRLQGLVEYRYERNGKHPTNEDSRERRPPRNPLIPIVLVILVVGLLIGGAGAVLYLKDRHPASVTTPTLTPTIPSTGKVDCSFVFLSFIPPQVPDNGEHAVCLKNLETPLSDTGSIYNRTLTLVAAYADTNRLLVRFAVEGQDDPFATGAIILKYLTIQKNILLGPTDGGGYYYDHQKGQTFYLASFAMASLPDDTAALSVTATFQESTSYSITGSGESASFTFTVPMHQDKQTVALFQRAEMNGHQLTLTKILVTASMTRLYIKTDPSVTPTQSWILSATMNGSTSTIASEDPPNAGKYDHINGLIITSLEDFSDHSADGWTVRLISGGNPLGEGTLDISFTI